MLVLPFTVHSVSVLSTITDKEIQGTAPYLTFNGGVTKARTTEELLGITLSTGEEYTKTTNPSTESDPIELPEAGQKLKDIKTLIPTNNTSVNLSDLLTNDNWGDDNGDGNITLTKDGTLSISAVDANGKTVGLSDELDACNAPYKLTLTSTSGAFETEYGLPRETKFDGSTADYYIKPKDPKACIAQPSLVYGDNTGKAPNGGVGYNFAGPPNQWDSTKGFKIQNLGIPSSNFPTTGSNNLYFNLMLKGASGTIVWTYEQSPEHKDFGGTSDIKLEGVENNTTSTGKITLSGPSYSNKPTQKFVPTTFTIKANGVAVYRFEISKWFIARAGAAGGYSNAPIYCKGLGGDVGDYYRVPKVIEYTNSASATVSYTRTIGGGLFAEWGSIVEYGSVWEKYSQWASDKWNSSYQYAVTSAYGRAPYYEKSEPETRAACVSP